MTARPKRPPPPIVRWLAAPVVLAALAFGWWTISPLFISTRVDEAFPTAAADAAPVTLAEATPTVAPTPASTAAPTAVPAAPVAATADTAPSPLAEPTAAALAPTAAPAETTAVPAEPVALTSGSFTRIDSLHWAEGSATIYRLPDGSHLLRLEPFTAQNGPDLFVGLSGHPMPRSHAQAYDTGYVELDRLKANEGNQNYVIPPDVDPSAFKSVVIYCKAFSVVFSTAELMS